MRISIARKVMLTIGGIVLVALLAMLITYFAATRAIESIRQSKALSQTLSAAVSDMEVDIVSGGLRVFQYLESGDVYYQEAYKQHNARFRQLIDQRVGLGPFDEWRNAVGAVATQYQELDRASVSVMATHDRMHKQLHALYATLPRLVAGSNALFEGTAPDSQQFIIGKKIEAGRTATFISLMDFIDRDRGDDTLSARLGAVRPLIAAYGKLPLTPAGRKRIDDFERMVDDFSARVEGVLRSSKSKRDDMAKVLLLQRQTISAINTRIKPALQQHTDEALRQAEQHMRQVLYMAGAILLLLSLLAVFAGRYLWRSIVKPIRQLAAGADAVAAGHLDHRVAIASRDEYAELADDFNHMVGQLQGTMVSRALHEEQASQLRTLLDSVHDYAIFSVDSLGCVTHWNAASARILGYAADDMEGASFGRIFADSKQAAIASADGLKAIGVSGHHESDSTLIRKNGETFEANLVVTPLETASNAAAGYTVVVRDVTEHMQTRRHIEQLATRDSLTGLYNRNMLMEQLTAAIARAARSQTQVAVMFIDLDHFKNVNDTQGHAAGDALLRECAQRLNACVRAVDIVARLGGDEFVVLLTQITDAASVRVVADRMLTMLVAPYQLPDQEARTSASIGICFYPADGEDVTTLMKNADIAMYHAKDQHRNNYQFYAEKMNQRMLARAQLERELRAALENREFVLHYQPQVSVTSGQILGVESLVRWQHPAKGLLSPAHFIEAAEDTGLIVPMGEWILDHACQTLKAWRDKGVNVPYVGVNVSAAQLTGDLVTSVRNTLAKHDIEAGWLMLEITETMLMARVEEAILILKRIRELGVRIAMDDFGTGYSSLSVLQRLPLDTLKIDRSFVNAIDQPDNNPALAIIGAIVAIAQELDLTVVAEGVETPTQLAFLRTLGCGAYQGFLFSKPLDTMMLETQLAAPLKSVMEDEDGRAISMTRIVNLELPTGP